MYLPFAPTPMPPSLGLESDQVWSEGRKLWALPHGHHQAYPQGPRGLLQFCLCPHYMPPSQDLSPLSLHSKLSYCSLHKARDHKLEMCASNWFDQNNIKEKKFFCPGWHGSVDWAPACKPKGCQFDSWCGPGPPLGVCKSQSSLVHQCFSPSLFSYLSLSLRNK